jgi:hypothetical protein
VARGRRFAAAHIFPRNLREAAVKPLTLAGGAALAVNLLGGPDGDRLLAREPVTAADLLLPRDETWLQGLRAGVLGADLSNMNLEVLAASEGGDERLAGYTLQLSDGDRRYRRTFPLASLAQVARRPAVRLIEEGKIAEGDRFLFSLSARPAAADDGAATPPAGTFKRRLVPPVFEPAPLADYLRCSEVLVGRPLDDAESEQPPVPVFVTESVWDEAHQLARRGGERESAAVWTGRLWRDTASSEIFVTLDACLEAQHADEEQFSVTFSGETWARLRQVLDVRRRRLGRPHERFLGSVHGHNFLPEADDKGRRTCELCATAAMCTRTTAAASAADLEWHRSVFVGQPWATLLVWGFNAREQEEWRLYGLADATLTPRTLHILRESLQR